jgi:hypothetical protein
MKKRVRKEQSLLKRLQEAGKRIKDEEDAIEKGHKEFLRNTPLPDISKHVASIKQKLEAEMIDAIALDKERVKARTFDLTLFPNGVKLKGNYGSEIVFSVKDPLNDWKAGARAVGIDFFKIENITGEFGIRVRIEIRKMLTTTILCGMKITELNDNTLRVTWE